MNGLIHELITDLKTNENLKNSIATTMVLESINNSKLLGVPEAQILENALQVLESLSKEMSNNTMKEVVAKFRKMAEKPTAKLQNMAKEAGLSMKIKALKESSIAQDPMVKQTISKIEANLAQFPEFKVIGFFAESLMPYTYDKAVAEAITDVVKYCDANQAKLEIMNSVYEMRIVGSVTYGEPCAILEESLLENLVTADSLNMKLRNYKNMPIVSKLINRLSMMEAQQTGKFNLGTGSGETVVSPVIAPFYKLSESEEIIFSDNTFIKISESAEPTTISNEEVLAESQEFYKTCEAFNFLNFKQIGQELSTSGKKLRVSLGINEKGNLNLKINGSIVEDVNSINYSELFVMEHINTRHALTTLFNNIDYMVNAEFGKKIVNERLGRESMVINIGENIFVLEKNGNSKTTKKMQGIGFYNYVLENFKYDVSELYSIQLEERAEQIKSFDSEKTTIEENINKLELTINKINDAIADKSIDSANREKLNELKIAIEKNVNQLKSQYILIDQAKKNF